MLLLKCPPLSLSRYAYGFSLKGVFPICLCFHDRNFVLIGILYRSFLPRRLSPLNMPDYAEVAGCSSFKNDLGGSPSYDNYGAYASTTLVGRSTGNHPGSIASSVAPAPGGPMFAQNQFDGKNVYSAPTSCHYNNFINQHQLRHQQQLHQQQPNGSGGGVEPKRPYGAGGSMKSQKMNIIENRMADMMNNLGHSQTSVASAAALPGLPGSPYGGSSVSNLNANSSSNLLPAGASGASVSVPHTPLFGTIKRTTKYNKIGYNKDNKLNFGDNGRSTEQPLFIKSKYDGTWSSVPSTAASSANNINMINNSPYHQQHQQQQQQQHHQSQQLPSSSLSSLGHHHHHHHSQTPTTTTTATTTHQFAGKGPGSSNILDPLPNGCGANNLDNQPIQNNNPCSNGSSGSNNGSSSGSNNGSSSPPNYLSSFGKTDNV